MPGAPGHGQYGNSIDQRRTGFCCCGNNSQPGCVATDAAAQGTPWREPLEEGRAQAGTPWVLIMQISASSCSMCYLTAAGLKALVITAGFGG